MFRAYIDESQSPQVYEGELKPIGYGVYYIACLLADEMQMNLLSQRFTEIRQRSAARFGTPPNAEFHGHCMFQFKEDWEALKGKPRAAIGIYRQVMRAIVESGAQLFIRGINEEQLKQRYDKYAHNPHTLALQYCLERVNYYAESNEIDMVEIVADRVADPMAHEGMMRRYQILGRTEGYVASDLAHISFPFSWEDSCKYDGLQAVDTALFIISRALRVNPIDKKKQDHAVLNTARMVMPALHPTSAISCLMQRMQIPIKQSLDLNSLWA